MRVYFKGVALGLVLLLFLLLVHRHFRSQHSLTSGSNGAGKRSRERVTSGEKSAPRGRAARAGRQGAATSAARIQAAGRMSKKAAKAQKKNSDGGGSAQGQSSAAREVAPNQPTLPRSHPPIRSSHPRATPTREATPQRTSKARTSKPLEVVREPTVPAAASREQDVGGEGSPGKVEPAQQSSQPAKAGEGPATSAAHAPGEQAVQKMTSAESPAQKAPDVMDIRTVDPLSATEPLVIRQQEELEQQRFGFQPWRGRPKPPEKVQNQSQTWLKDMVYPDWYLESVKRSKVFGREKEFVGGAALYEGPCPGAEQVRARYVAEKVKTFSYIEPGQFIASSKNPCWYEDPKRKKQMRCLPYFYVAGVAKCGTTDLYKRVRFHPDIMEGELKEYHWWDRLRYGAPMELKFTKDSEKNDSPLPLAEYSRIITGKEIDVLKSDLRSKNHSDRICGDGSPSYLWDASQWTIFVGNEGCTEPRIVSGSFIQHANPKSKILLIFRHPTQRLYSRFLSRIPRTPAFRGASPQMFHGFVVKAINCYKKCFAEHSIRECAYNETLYDEAVIRIIEGMYSVFVEDWLRIFKRDQMLMIRSEDYSDDIEGHILKVFDFLGVAALDKAHMRPILTHVSTNIGQYYGKVGPMLPETIQLLNEFYKPFVLRLHELLGEEKFLWKDIAVT